MPVSFTTEVKNELAHNGERRPCCAAAEIAGFIRACGAVTIEIRVGLGVRMSTENAAVARRYKTLIDNEFGIRVRLMVGETKLGRHSHVYELSVPAGARADRLLTASGIVRIQGDARTIASGFSESMMKRKCCRKACLRGLFLGAGAVSDPEKGYNFEIVLASEQTAVAVRRLMSRFTDIHAKVRARRGNYVVFLRSSEQIKDVLVLIGAHAQLLRYENVRVLKDVRNTANRLSNCDNANMEKALAAASRQLADIAKIEAGEGLDALPGDLLNAALARKNRPEASLTEIGAMLDPPIGKAAAGARFKRIAEFVKR